MAEFNLAEPYSEQYKKWLWRVVEQTTDAIKRETPTEFAEANRYLPRSVTRFSGYISFELTPYWYEILDCFSPDADVREVAVMKGVQVAYTTALETIIFYIAGHIRTAPAMYATADRGLSAGRMENNIIPMFQQSGFSHIFKASDTENARKQGITKAQLQWIGGGYLIPYGARNADKMRQFSIEWMLMDEIDAWDQLVKGGGDPVRLFKDRCAAYWQIRKIFMGSTPLYKGASHIEKQFARGDRRRYFCRCLKCGFLQVLRWSHIDPDTNKKSGFTWELRNDGKLDLNSVRYECQNCGHGHQEHDKTRLFSRDNAEWRPTATPVEPGVRSYHIPALLSPVGMQPWSKSVALWLESMDVESGRVKDLGALQVFYNNVLGEPFEHLGSKVTFSDASSHRRTVYHKGEVPNIFIKQHCESDILLLTGAVDVHKTNLAVSVWGWTRGQTNWLVEYFRLFDETDAGCANPDSPVWGALRELIEEKRWTSNDGKEYPLAITLIDSGWAPSTVVDFCGEYASGVYPIVGRDRPTRTQAIKEFAPFTTQAGTMGFRILVDHYKDRIASVLRRGWKPELGLQKPYTFNAPMDTLDLELKELTREYKREKTNEAGVVKTYWYRPQGAENELWDLMVYAHASIDILAWSICVKHFGEELVDWPRFWDLLSGEQLFFANVTR